MALDEAVTGALAIGLGCRRNCPAEVLVSLVEAACAGLDRTDARLFTIARKRDEAGLVEAARRLAMPLAYFDVGQLASALPDVATRSARVAAAVGVASVAEAAALAGAGRGGRLVVPRCVMGGATCAVAQAGAP